MIPFTPLGVIVLTFLQPYNLTEGYKITVLRGGSQYGVVILI